MKKKSAKMTVNKKIIKTTKASTKKPAAKAAKITSSSTPKKRGVPKKIQLSTANKKTEKSVVVTVATPNKKTPAKRRKKINTLDDITPVSASMNESFAVTRRNKSSSIERTDRFKNIDDGLIPFKWTGTYAKKTNVTIKDAIVLCQKCYYNFATFRNVIDLMTEFSTSNVYFRGGNKKSRKFFEAFFKKINLWAFQEKFFREYYRSGNVFIYRFDAKFKDSDLKKISQTFGVRTSSDKLPIRYILLNPADGNDFF
jgi:hypothetical protein